MGNSLSDPRPAHPIFGKLRRELAEKRTHGKYGGQQRRLLKNDWVDLLPQMKIEAPAKEGRDNLKVALWRHSGANVNLIAHQNPCDGPPPCIPGEAERTTDQAPSW